MRDDIPVFSISLFFISSNTFSDEEASSLYLSNSSETPLLIDPPFKILTGASSSIFGGLAAMYAMKNPYGMAAVTSLVCFAVALAFKEPPAEKSTSAFWAQVKDCVGYLQVPQLKWLFSFMVIFTV